MSQAVAPARTAPERKKPVAMSQRWMCPECKRTGTVPCTSADDAAKVFELVYEAHKLKSPGCSALIRFGQRARAEHFNEHKSALDVRLPD